MLGAMLGSYRVTEHLATGGMGEVYIGEHKLIGRKAAIKVLLPQVSQSRRIVERFFQEAKATAQLAHPGIVEIFDYGSFQGQRAFLVMEYLSGETLSQRIKRRVKMRLPQILALVEHVCDALGAAHAAGIIHRDLKPDNIFLVRDTGVRFGERPKLLDFGIAKLKDSEISTLKTGTGVVMGTPAYMSPEQCRGAGGVDERSDLYSLGCILFELVCGRRPFIGVAAGELIGLHQFKEPPRPSEFVEDVDPRVEAIITKLLRKRPGDRFQTTGQLAMALSAVRAELDVEADDTGASAEFGFADADDDETAISGAPVLVSSPDARDDEPPPLPSIPPPGGASAHPSSPPAPADAFLRGETDPIAETPGAVTEPTPMPVGRGHERSIPPAPLLPDERASGSHSALPGGKSNSGIKVLAGDMSDDTPLTTLHGAASVTLPPPDIRPNRRPWLVIGGALAAGVALLVVLLGRGGDPTTSPTSGEAGDDTGEPVAAAPAVPAPEVAKPDMPANVADAPGELTPDEPAGQTASIPVTPPADNDGAGATDKKAAPEKTAPEKTAPEKTAAKTTVKDAEGPAKAAAEAPVEYVTLTIESSPTGATVKLNGKSLGKTPVHHKIERGDGSVTFDLVKKGYKPASVRVSSAETDTRRVSLKKKPTRKATGKKPAGSTTKIRTDIF